MTDVTTRPFAYITTIKELMQTAESLGSYFFSIDTMRWFDSTVSKKIRVAELYISRDVPDAIQVLFITSERQNASVGRRYTLRLASVYAGRYEKDSINFEVIGEFGQYGSLHAAKKALRRLPLIEWTNTDEYKERTLT